MIKSAFTQKNAMLTRNLDLNIKTVKYYIRSIASYGVETRTLRIVEQSHVESIEMWC